MKSSQCGCDFSSLHLIPVRPHPLLRYHPMTTAEVRCFGCNRKFSPHGFSQHVSKAPDPHCRTSSATGEVPLVATSGSIHRTAFPRSLDPFLASQRSGRVSPEDFGMYDYGLDGHNDETDMRNDTQSPGSGRVRPNDLDGHDDETDRHDGTELPDGEYNSCCRLKPHHSLTYLQILTQTWTPLVLKRIRPGPLNLKTSQMPTHLQPSQNLVFTREQPFQIGVPLTQQQSP